jgi:hypothetical protein
MPILVAEGRSQLIHIRGEAMGAGGVPLDVENAERRSSGS